MSDIQLIQQLSQARDDYYAFGESTLTDDEYDALKRKLGLDARFELDREVPAREAGFKIVSHRRHMPSIDRCARDRDELERLLPDGEEKFLSIKYDGLSVELQYVENRLIAAVLRGDGDRGEDVLENMRNVGKVPAQVDLPNKLHFSVFGELLISFNNLACLNEIREAEGQQPYKTARNAVNLVRSTPTPSLRRKLNLLTFKAFDVHYEGHTVEQPEYPERMEVLHLFGFDPVDVERTFYNATVMDNLDLLGKLRKPYEVDGIITQNRFLVDGIVIRSGASQDILTKVKFPPEAVIAKVVAIRERLGRTGVVTPVIELEPVLIGGVTVTNVTGHNYALIMDRFSGGLGPGAEVLISRRGDVIPHVERVIAPGQRWMPTSECPSCGAAVIQDGSIRRCSADPTECSGTLSGLLIKFCRVLAIDGVGPGVATSLVAAGIETPAALLSASVVDLAKVPTGVGEYGLAMAAKLWDSIHAPRIVTRGMLLGSLGIRGCSVSIMESIADKVDWDDWPNLSREWLCAQPGIGPERAEAILDFVETRWDELVVPLIDLVKITDQGVGALTGKTFCITLALDGISRPEMEAKIRAAGGGVKSSVTREVTHLVCNQPNADTTKHRRATDLGIPIIDQRTLEAMMGIAFDVTSHTESDPF